MTNYFKYKRLHFIFIALKLVIFHDLFARKVPITFARLLSIFLFLFVYTGSAQSKEHIEFYDMSNVQTSNNIMSIVKDSLGFIWLGTDRGISRYDGKSFSAYLMVHEETGHPKILKQARSLYIDPEQNLWIGGNYLSKFDYSSNRVNYITDTKLGMIETIIKTPDGNLWLGGRRGLAVYNAQQKATRKIDLNQFNPNVSVQNLFYSEVTKSLWIATRQQGIFQYHLEDDFLEHISHLSVRDIRSFAEFNHTLWIGTSRGIYLLNHTNQKMKPLHHEELNNTPINDLAFSADSTLWVGTEKGVLKVKMQTNASSWFHKENSNLTGNRVSDLYFDGQFVWAGIAFEGLAQFKPTNLAKSYSRKNGYDLKSNRIWSLFAYDRENYWIGTDQGVHCLNSKNNTVSPLSLPILDAIKIRSMLKSKNGNIWLSTDRGLFEFNPVLKSIRKHFKNQRFLPPDFIVEQQNGTLWFGSRAGLTRYDPLSRKRFDVKPHPSRGRPLFMRGTEGLHLDNDTILYSLSSDKIHTFRTSDLTTKPLERLNHYDISNFCVDSEKRRLWFLHKKGVSSLNLSTNKLIDYTVSPGIDGHVPSMILDKKGNPWFTNGKSVYYFSADSQRFQPLVANIKPGTFFSRFAALVTERGTLLFGSSNGVLEINPQNVSQPTNEQPLFITEIFYKTNTTSNSTLRVDKNPTLALDYDHVMIKVHYSTFNYSTNSNPSYRYQLVGLNTDWIETNQSELVYSTIRHGSYTLRIQTKNPLGQWVSEKTLSLEILPPFWETWWAYLFYTLVVLGLFIAILHHLQVKKNHALARMELKVAEKDTAFKVHEARVAERENIRKQAAADFHDELGHRLTKISLLSNLASSNLNGSEEKQIQYLNKINLHAKETYSEMKEFIWELNPEQDSLFDVIARLKDFGEDLFKESKITFLSHEIPEQLTVHKLVPDDKKNLFLLFKEAMNNALKYSNADEVLFQSQIENTELSIQFKDNGVGFIQETKQNNSYGLKTMSTRAEELHAKLTIRTELNKGTSITVWIKLKEALEDKLTF